MAFLQNNGFQENYQQSVDSHNLFEAKQRLQKLQKEIDEHRMKCDSAHLSKYKQIQCQAQVIKNLEKENTDIKRENE